MNTTPQDILGNHQVNSHLTARIREERIQIDDINEFDGTSENVDIYTKEDARKLAELLLQWADS